MPTETFEQTPVAPELLDRQPLDNPADPRFDVAPLGPTPTETMLAAGSVALESQTTASDPESDDQESQIDAQVGRLRSYIDEIAGGDELSPATRDYLRQGGGIQAALAEIHQLRPKGDTVAKEPTEADKKLEETRTDYTHALTHHGRQTRSESQAAYATALIEKIKEVSGIEDDSELTLEELADKEMGFVTDMLLVERSKLHQQVAENRQSSRLHRVLSNKKVRGVLIASVMTGALTSYAGILPGGSESIAYEVDTALEMLASFALTTEVQDSLYGRLADRIDRRQAKKLDETLAQDEEALQLAHRTAQKPEALASERPYSEAEADRLTNGIYAQHVSEIRSVAESENTSEQFMQLIATLVSEEVERSRREILESKARRGILSALALTTSFAFTGVTYNFVQAAEATGAAKKAMAEAELGSEDA